MRKLINKYVAAISQWRQKNPHSVSKTRLVIFFHDVCMIPIAWALAYWLRFNLGKISQPFIDQAIRVLPVIILVQAIFYWLFGLYRGVWRFASLPDLIRICKVVIVSICASCLILFLNAQLSSIPRSIFPLYGLLLVVLLVGSRVCYRWLKDYAEINRKHSNVQRLLIVGAGQAGESIVRDLQRHANCDYQVIGFVDDRSNKSGQEIHGVRVLGKVRDIPELVKQHQIDLIIIAIPSAGSAQMRRIVNYCEISTVPFRTLPSIQDLASGNIKIDAWRTVSLEDLLGRDAVSLDWENIRSSVQNNVILVSGGGGSIGAELCRQIARLSPRKLIVIEQNEFNLYTLTLELTQAFPELEFSGHLLDVTDRAGVEQIMQQQHIDIVFHAAAYKHVPMLENQIRVAIHNNILGTQVLAEISATTNVKKFVLISTDKAVNPTNVMGATKRAAEIFCQNYGLHCKTQFITVRFGNVLGSAGSVVPLFKKQIEMGGPVTVTHPEITRFFMTIPEAAQLILQSTVLGQGGEIFVLDMGEPIKIRYLAEQMILLAGLTPGQDIEISYTGLRPGEKLYEELFHENEPLLATSHEKIMQAKYRQRDWHELVNILTALEQACKKNQTQILCQLLMELVPEYQCRLELGSLAMTEPMRTL